MADKVSEQVRMAIAKVKKIPLERVQATDSLEGLGVDSLDAVTMMFELEETFQISIPDEKVRSLRTVQEIIDGIRALRGDAADAAAGS
jgi:acyl carrier protein